MTTKMDWLDLETKLNINFEYYNISYSIFDYDIELGHDENIYGARCALIAKSKGWDK